MFKERKFIFSTFSWDHANTEARMTQLFSRKTKAHIIFRAGDKKSRILVGCDILVKFHKFNEEIRKKENPAQLKGTSVKSFTRRRRNHERWRQSFELKFKSKKGAKSYEEGWKKQSNKKKAKRTKRKTAKSEHEKG